MAITPMKPEPIRKTARAIVLILRLSGNLATRKTVALEYASNAGLRKPVAVKLVEKLARNEGAP